MFLRNLFFVVTLLSLQCSTGKTEVPISEFFPFGINEGDTQLTTNDDDSSPEINLGISFPFVDYEETRLWVNTNGDITFAGPYASYTPQCIALGVNLRMVIPFWTDIDMRNGGRVRQTGVNGVILNLTIFLSLRPITDRQLEMICLERQHLTFWLVIPTLLVLI